MRLGVYTQYTVFGQTYKGSVWLKNVEFKRDTPGRSDLDKSQKHPGTEDFEPYQGVLGVAVNFWLMFILIFSQSALI